MVTVLTVALMFSVGLVAYFVSAGEFWEASKAAFAGVGIFALLAARLTMRHKARVVGY